MMAGLVTGLVHTRFGINALLAGILTTTALYCGNLYIMGGGDRSVAGVPTLITRAEQAVRPARARRRDAMTLLGTPGRRARTLAALLLLMLVVVPVVGWLLALFFGTSLGLALRATGDNPQMARALGVSVTWRDRGRAGDGERPHRALGRPVRRVPGLREHPDGAGHDRDRPRERDRGRDAGRGAAASRRAWSRSCSARCSSG